MSWLSRKDSSSHFANEIRFYSNLANSYLDQKNLSVKDINSDFKDGTKFVALVESLFNAQIQHDSNPVTCVKNAIQHLKAQKIPTCGIEADQFINNKDNAVLRMLKSVFDYRLVRTVNYKVGSIKAGEKSLNQWIIDNTSECRNLQIKDFKGASFSNGIAFCALVSHFSPQLIDFRRCKEDNIGHNYQLLNAALNTMGIPSLLHADLFKDKDASNLYALQAALLFHFYNKVTPVSQPSSHEASYQFAKKESALPPKSVPSPSTPKQSITAAARSQSDQLSMQSTQPQVKARKIPTQELQQFIETEKHEELKHLKLFKSSTIEINNAQFDYHTILELVVQNEHLIRTEGKDVIVFLGASQAGKSTSINIIRGAKYQYKGLQTLELVTKSDNYAKTGNIAGESVTLFPQTYELDNFVLLDSQGFFDTRKGHTEREIAGILLLEMALKKAKSVRAICVIDFGDLSRGAVGMDKSGEIIERLFMDTDKEPLQIFFLFNRVIIQNQEMMAKFYQMTDDHKKYDYQVQIVLDIIKDINKTITDDTSADYFQMLHYNASKMNIGVCDPSNNKITDILKKQLAKIPIVKEENIYLFRASTNREQFQLNLIYSMINGLVQTTKHYLALKYPKELLDSISKEINNGLAIVEKQIEIVKSTPIDDLNTDADDEQFHQNLNELQRKLCKCDSDLQLLNTKLEQINNSTAENINQNIVEITRSEIKQLEDKIVTLEKEITEKSAQIDKVNNDYQKAKQHLDDYRENIEAGCREKQSVIDDLERHVKHAQTAIYDINHIIQDFESLDPLPIFSHNKTLAFGKPKWEVNVLYDMPFDYENPKEQFDRNNIKKTILQADSHKYHAIYERKCLFHKKYVELSLYTWKKYKKDNRSYLRTKISQRESYLKEIESNLSQIRSLESELDLKVTQSEIQIKAKAQAMQTIDNERHKLLAEITSLRESLHKSKEQLEMKKRSLTRLETQQINQKDETSQTKTEINSQIQEINAAKIGLNNQMNTITENHALQKQKSIESMQMQRKQLEDTFASLTKFSGQFKENLTRLNQTAAILQTFYGEAASYDKDKLVELCMISHKLVINVILTKELKSCLSNIGKAKLQPIYACEPLNPELFRNPEIEQNIWLMNNIQKEKQSLICFLQGMEHEITLYNRWQAETELFNLRK